jgi:hypothetical protein
MMVLLTMALISWTSDGSHFMQRSIKLVAKVLFEKPWWMSFCQHFVARGHVQLRWIPGEQLFQLLGN